MYKLIKYLCNYVNLEEIQSSIEIKSKIACNGLHKLGFVYNNIKKDIFIDKHKRPNVVENCKKFLNIMKDLEPYLVKFEEDRSMKTKKYLDNCAIGKYKGCFVIIIIHNKYIFFVNNEIWKA